MLEAETKTILEQLGKAEQAAQAIQVGTLTLRRGKPEQVSRFFNRFHTLEQARLAQPLSR